VVRRLGSPTRRLKADRKDNATKKLPLTRSLPHALACDRYKALAAGATIRYETDRVSSDWSPHAAPVALARSEPSGTTSTDLCDSSLDCEHSQITSRIWPKTQCIDTMPVRIALE